MKMQTQKLTLAAVIALITASQSLMATLIDNSNTLALWHMDEQVQISPTRVGIADDTSVTGRSAENLTFGKNTDNVVNHPSLVDSMAGYGKALLFDSANQQTSLNLGLWQGGNTAVVQFWANQSTETSLTESVINANGLFDIRMGSGTLTAYIWLAAGGTTSLSRSYTQGEWTDVEMIVTADEMFLTVNGSTASKTITGIADLASTTTRLGSSATYTRYFNGMVDEVRIGVVPEPATIAMMGLGFLGLRLKRKFNK